MPRPLPAIPRAPDSPRVPSSALAPSFAFQVASSLHLRPPAPPTSLHPGLVFLGLPPLSHRGPSSLTRASLSTVSSPLHARPRPSTLLPTCLLLRSQRSLPFPSQHFFPPYHNTTLVHVRASVLCVRAPLFASRPSQCVCVPLFTSRRSLASFSCPSPGVPLLASFHSLSLSLHANPCVYLYFCMLVTSFVFLCVCPWARKRVYSYEYTCLYLCVCVCPYVCAILYVQAHLLAITYVCVCPCVCVCP